MSEAPTTTFGPYDLEKRIAVGNMSEVFRARDSSSGREVCLMRFVPHLNEAPALGMQLDEARVFLKLAAHPHVVTLLDIGAVDGAHYVATELVEGPSLDDLIRRGPLRIADVIGAGTALCRALTHVHAAGFLHRHLSPRKLRGGKLLGLGLPDSIAFQRTGSMTPGRFRYFSPEAARGHAIDARNDQYAVAVILWEALIGRRLFSGTNIETLQAIVDDTNVIAAPSSLRSDVPPALDAAIMRALSRNRDARFADMRAFEAALHT
jgi:eukaryotic-like serine/threonine-protein kinase